MARRLRLDGRGWRWAGLAEAVECEESGGERKQKRKAERMRRAVEMAEAMAPVASGAGRRGKVLNRATEASAGGRRQAPAFGRQREAAGHDGGGAEAR